MILRFLQCSWTGRQDGPRPVRRRCPARLWCRKKDCLCLDGGSAAADAGTVLSYWKLRDTVADGRFWERQLARLLSLLFRPAYRRAAALRPEYDRTVRECLEELQGAGEGAFRLAGPHGGHLCPNPALCRASQRRGRP